MINEETKEQIRKTLSSLLEGFLNKNTPSGAGQIQGSTGESAEKGQLKPFHSAILTPATVTVSKYERSFSTTLGSMFEAVAELIGQQNFAFAKRQYDVAGQMGTAASTTIDSIRNEIENNKMNGRYLQYVEAVKSSFHADMMTRSIKADLYLKGFDGTETFFEMKSPKPNKSQCLDVTSKLLTIHALKQDGPPNVTTYYGMSYNPYGSKQQYKHSFALNYLDLSDQVLIGEDFWALIGGPGTYGEVLEAFGAVGQKYRSEILSLLQIN